MIIRLFLILTSVALAVSQTTSTVADPNLPGGSIVEVVSTNANGLPVTATVLSIPAGGAAATTSTTNPLAATTPTPVTSTTTSTSQTPTTLPLTTAPAAAQGPVAQPAPTTVPVGQGVTEYTYTTVDALGHTTVLQDFFTPSYNTLPPPSSPAVGTILGMSAWSALIGTNTAGGPTNGAVSWQPTRSGVGGLAALGCGIMAGALTLL